MENKSKQVYNYTVILEKEEDGGYHAFFPMLKGCHSQGDTYEETIENITEAIELYLESLMADNQPIPQYDKSMTIPPKIRDTIKTLNQELEQIENEANRGLEIVRELLPHFSDNLVLIQLLSTFHNSLMFRDNTKRRIQLIADSLSPPQLPNEVIQEAGEDLGELLGRVTETKILVSRAVKILEDL